MYQMGFLLSQVPDKASSCWGICIRSLHDIAKKGVTLVGEKNLTRVLIALAHEFNSLFLNDLKCPVRFGFYKKKKKRILGGKKVIFIEIYKV